MSRAALVASTAVLVMFTTLAAATDAAAQTPPSRERSGTGDWCKDATTVCWNNGGDGRRTFNGVRFVFEPQLGVLIQSGDNKFKDTNFKSIEKFGVASNLVGKWLSAQVLLIYPSTIQFDEKSPLRADKLLKDEADGKVDVEWGMTAGLTVVDGILSIGGGFMKYDRRDFKTGAPKSSFSDGFVYFNVQAIEALKGALKKGK